MATLIPKSYTTRFGGLPGTVAEIVRSGDGWIAMSFDDIRRKWAYVGNANYWTSALRAQVFRTAQQAADAAERALWL